MRLRRSDFLIYDYPKRKAWIRICRGLRKSNSHEAPMSHGLLVWAMMRANSRGLHALYRQSPFFTVIEAIGLLCHMVKRGGVGGAKAKTTIQALKSVMLPGDKALTDACFLVLHDNGKIENKGFLNHD